ncbi:hypothetical protein FEP49_00952 [Burkholderia multivorans]|nr:hypothetical protein [Burkholderia multivorans]
MRDGLETDRAIQRVRVGRHEHDPAQLRKHRLREHVIDQCAAIAAATLGRQHEHVAEIRERRMVGDEPRESDEAIADVRAETERPLDRALDDVARNAFRPVRVAMQEIEDRVDVEFALVGRKSERGIGSSRHGGSPASRNEASTIPRRAVRDKRPSPAVAIGYHGGAARRAAADRHRPAHMHRHPVTSAVPAHALPMHATRPPTAYKR